MSQKAPGKSYRKAISLVELMDMFSTEDAAREWFEQVRWPKGPICPYCGTDNVQSGIKHKTMTHRCRVCVKGSSKRMFSLKTGTVMEGSKLGYRVWAIAIYLLTTNLKGVSSMHLHHDVKVTQKTAWHLAHRIRESWAQKAAPFVGPVEVDETYIGGKEKNKHGSKKLRVGGGGGGKTVVVGAKDRETNAVTAEVVESADGLTLKEFVLDQVADGAKVYTDEARAYKGLPNHESVNHSVGEYVDGQAHTNGIESFWSMLKRGYHGVYHRMSAAHLDRYINEFSGRHNIRKEDTMDQMVSITRGLVGKRLRYKDLVAYNPPRKQEGLSDVF